MVDENTGIMVVRSDTERLLRLARASEIGRAVNPQPAEPPCTDPYARWCGRGGAARLPPIPIAREVCDPSGAERLLRQGTYLVYLPARNAAYAPPIVSRLRGNPRKGLGRSAEDLLDFGYLQLAALMGVSRGRTGWRGLP
jgi:hypothetical protein